MHPAVLPGVPDRPQLTVALYGQLSPHPRRNTWPDLDPLWEKPAVRHRVTFRGTLAEWSLDALGWLAAFLAEASAGREISQLLFTADRTH